MYDGTVLELDQDGDVRVPKAGGLSVGGVDVTTETFVTGLTNTLDSTVSQLVTSSSSHNQRLGTIENAGYATQSSLSIYATTSSLGTTNDTVGGINTRLNTLETAGYVTSAGLGGYNFATQGLRGWEFCTICQFFAHFSNLRNFPKVPSFRSETPVKSVFPRNAKKRPTIAKPTKHETLPKRDANVLKFP